MTSSPGATPVVMGREETLPFLPPREPLQALAFLNGALAMLDAVDARRAPSRRALLVARQEALDAVGAA